MKRRKIITLKSPLVKFKTTATIRHFRNNSSATTFWLHNQWYVATQFHLAWRHSVNRSSRKKAASTESAHWDSLTLSGDNFKIRSCSYEVFRNKLGETSKKKMLCIVFCFQSFVCQLSHLTDTHGFMLSHKVRLAHRHTHKQLGGSLRER